MLPSSTNLDPTCFDRDGEDILLLPLSELNAPKPFPSSTLLNCGTLDNISTYNGVTGLNFFTTQTKFLTSLSHRILCGSHGSSH